MDNNILSALKAIDVASLSYTDWIAVGMALKEIGYPVSVWDNWSRNDARYRSGECLQKWSSFLGNVKPVKAGTIIRMAKERGWTPSGDDGIEYDGQDNFPGCTLDRWNAVQDLITYLETIFNPDEYVAYSTSDAWQGADGKWRPAKGCFNRTAGELLASLREHSNDVAATMGEWNSEAGAWIRINPMDGIGVKDENVTEFRFALVESDTLPISEQYMLYRRVELPIAALVHSGWKSLHAIVRIDAKDYAEYRQRVDILYNYLENNGVSIDKQNRNPSRLSRMPGVTRNGKPQYLVDINIGRKSWKEWMDYVVHGTNDLPSLVSLCEYKNNPPIPPEELICGILRRGHKMLVSGPSKAGKSFLLMELAIAIAEGHPWLGFPCKKGRVLYINLEIDPDSAINRFFEIYAALDIPLDHVDDISIWNLRGHAIPLDQLVPKIISRVRGQDFDVIIIDPIYKVITGDENNASEMGYFCNQFDKICTETGCATIYCHHHSKGLQGAKRAMDRASGSGVFARDPDAQLDMIQLELDDDMRSNLPNSNATAWRMESSLREFPNIQPVNFWFYYPIHCVDTNEVLTQAYAAGSPQANLSKSSKRTSPQKRKALLDDAYKICSANLPVKVKDLAENMQINEKTVRRYLEEFKNDYWHENGIFGSRNA